MYGLLSGTAANAKASVLGYFTPEQISQAKAMLWNNCDQIILGTKPSRREGTVTPKTESDMSDIVKAIQKLDSLDKLPEIAVTAKELNCIPRSHPEELNNISLVDRLNTLEMRMTKFQETLDHTVCQNLEMKDKLSQMSPSYANVAAQTKSGNQVMMRGQSASFPVITDTVVAGLQTRSPVSNHGYNNGARPKVFENRKDTLKVPVPNVQNSVGESQSSQPRRPQPLSRSESCASVASAQSGFQFPQRRKNRAQRRANVISGNASSSNTFRGAPEPDRQLFIQRVDKSVTGDKIKKYLSDQKFSIREVCRMSHEEAKYNSFMITVPVSEFSLLFDPELWPTGVSVRRFRQKQHKHDKEGWD